MAEPTMSHIPDDAGAPRQSATSETSRVVHDRELPVTPSDADRAHAPRAASVDGAAVASGGASEPVNSSEPGAARSAAHATPPSTNEDDAEEITEDVVKLALRRVKDPELNLNILDLGLVYEIRVEGNDVAIDMTLTSPGCPSGPEIMTDAERHLRALPGVGNVTVNLVWSPFWSPDRIEPRVRAYLGF